MGLVFLAGIAGQMVHLGSKKEQLEGRDYEFRREHVVFNMPEGDAGVTCVCLLVACGSRDKDFQTQK